MKTHKSVQKKSIFFLLKKVVRIVTTLVEGEKMVCVCVNSWFLSPGEDTTIDFEFYSAKDVQDSRHYLF